MADNRIQHFVTKSNQKGRVSYTILCTIEKFFSAICRKSDRFTKEAAEKADVSEFN